VSRFSAVADALALSGAVGLHHHSQGVADRIKTAEHHGYTMLAENALLCRTIREATAKAKDEQISIQLFKLF
jgi:hypothetical protein